jgi:glutathione synthase/RimK-type ligase-like ATP-grasp enzyme
MDLRIATCRPLPEPDPDEEPLLAALRARGVRARMAAWRGADEDWDAPVPTVIRSTWDYPHHHAELLAWAERAERAAPLWNPAAVVRWNAHKGYLAELARHGFPIVPTAFVACGSDVRLAALMDEHGWGDVVVKPAISAASFATVRATRTDPDGLARGEAHLARLAAQRDVLVQRYAPAVESSGERALVWIAGELTHAVRKSPRFAHEDERVTSVPVADDERTLALALVAHARAELLYARIDLVRDEDGQPRLMELELVEPSLFLVQHPPALARLADALAERLRA